MANGMKIVTLTYEDYEGLIEIVIDKGIPDKNIYDEPRRTLDKLRSQGWEPMTAGTIRMKFGSQTTIFFKQSEE